MRSYVESRIDACGRKYEVEVFDRADNPFSVFVDTNEGRIRLADYDNRIDAINLACSRANEWLRGEHYRVDRPVN